MIKMILYGLKQAPHVWYNKIYSDLMRNSFCKNDGEPTLYIKSRNGKILMVFLFINDLVFIGNDDFLINDFKKVIKNEFDMIDLGLLRYFLVI